MSDIEEQQAMPSVGIHLSQTGMVQITFKGAIAAMDEVTGEAVLTMAVTQLQDLKNVMDEFIPN